MSASGIQVINRAAEILRQLKRDNSGQSLGAIAVETGLPRSTVQRIVGALIAEDFVATSGKNGDLRLGPEIQSLAAAGRIDVVDALRPALARLSALTGETVDLAIFRDDRMTFVDQIAGRQRLRAVSVPGEDFPLTNTANGKAALSLIDDQRIAEICRNEAPKLKITAFLAEISRIRESGLAFDLDEHTEGISAAGVAFEARANEIYAVSIPAPTDRFNRQRREIEKALASFLDNEICGNFSFLDPRASN